MQASELISDVRKELLEITGTFWSDAELLRIINRGIAHFSGEARIRETTAFLSTENGEAEYTLPANCLAVRIIMYKVVSSDGKSTWRNLKPTTIAELSRIRPQFLLNTTESLGTPEWYAVWDRKIRLERIPGDSTASNLFMFYKARITKLINVNQSIGIDDSLVEAIQDFVLWKAWMKEKEVQLALDAKLRYDEGIRRGRRYVKKLAQSARNRMDIASNVPFSGSRNPFSPFD